MCVLISCEFAGDQVPGWFDETLPQRKKDPGPDRDALYLAQRMSARLECPLVRYPWDGRLIQVGKSLSNPRLFGPAARKWSPETRRRLVDELYLPYHKRLTQQLRGVSLSESFVIHLSIQTFPLRKPKGQIRRGDVGLIYDPANADQMDLAIDWIDEMWETADMLKVRRNSPSAGTVDSIIHSMAEEFDSDDYVGIGLMANQAWASRPCRLRDEAIDAMVDAFKVTLQWPMLGAA